MRIYFQIIRAGKTAPGWGSSFQKRTNRSPPRDRNAAGRSNFQPRDLRREDRLLAGDLAKFAYADIRYPMFLFAARGGIISGMIHDGVFTNASSVGKKMPSLPSNDEKNYLPDT